MNENSDAPCEQARERYLPASVALSEYIGFLEEKLSEESRDAGMREHIDEWHRCMEVMQALARSEAGLADNAPVEPLPAQMRELEADLLSSPQFMRSYNDLPTRMRMVDLQRLVIYQSQVSLDHEIRVADEISRLNGPAALFRFCQGVDRELPPLHFERYGDDMVIFSSPSQDMRYLEPLILQQGQATGYVPAGKVGAVLGLAVGFGSNLLNAIEYKGRLLLNNGYHRSMALLNAGVRHVPCVIQTVRHPDEFSVAGTKFSAESREFYFSNPRPPMLKDFVDSRLYRDVDVISRERRVVIRFQVSAVDVTL